MTSAPQPARDSDEPLTGASGRGRAGLPGNRLLALPEEILFFGRSAVYALAVAAIYWFLTYETAGTVLLGGFGLASVVLAGLLLWKRPRRGTDGASDEERTTTPDGPFGNESGAVPSPTLAPLELGVGLALLILTVPFGPAMALASVLPLAVGALGWLRAVQSEPPFPDELTEAPPPPTP